MRGKVCRSGRLPLVLVSLLVAGMIVSCDLGSLFGGGEVPSVVIERPPNNAEVRLGEEIPIIATATDSTGVTRAELWVDDAVYASETSPVAEGQASFSAVLNWRAEVRGTHKIVVRAYNVAGNVGESAAITLSVVERGPLPSPTEPGPQPSATGPQPTPPGPQPTPPGPQATSTQPAPPPPTPTQPQPPAHTATPTETPTQPPPAGPCLPTVVNTLNVGGHPKGVAVHGHRAYVGIHDAPVVVVINTDTDTVLPQTLDTGVSGPHYANGVTFHTGSGLVYVANKSDDSVSAVDPSGAASPIVVPTNSQPFGVAAAGQYVYVANFGADRVSRIDVTTHLGQSLVTTFHKPALIGALGQDIFVPTNGPGPIYRIPAAGSPIPIGPNKTGYFAVAVNTTSNRVFVTDRDGGDVIKINGNTNSVEGHVHLPAHRPYGIAVNPNKGRIYAVAAEADLLYIIEGPTMQIVGSVPVGGQGAVEGGQGIALWGDKIYVSNYQDGTVTVLDDSACP